MTELPFALELQEVSHVYGKLRAVDHVSLHINVGEVVCLLGPSGCGKSTILRIAAGLEALQQGRVGMGGVSMADGDGALSVPPELRGVGLVFQDFALFPHLTVADNVAFGLDALTPALRASRVAEVLDQVDMSAFAGAYPHALSGGQQQRVALARALAPKPRVLLLDEPFSGLDARLREQIREDTLHVLKQSGTATLMVTHDPEEAMFMADRIYLMEAGRVVQSGSPEALYHRPVNAFVARFFTSLNTFRGKVTDGHVTCPIGRLPAPGHADGTEVDILVRPEGLHLVQPGTASVGGDVVAARVEEVRFLGAIRLLLVSLPDPAGGAVTLRIRHGGGLVPEVGGPVLLRLDPADALIFAAAKAGAQLDHRANGKTVVLSVG
jgi:iron(III) transport system ATP-binding protein